MRQLPNFVADPHSIDDDIRDADNYIDQAREVYLERIRAHRKHDGNNGSMERKDFDDPAWLPVVGEEYGEVAKVLCEEGHLSDPSAKNRNRFKNDLRGELIQVMAMCSAWVDAIDMDEGETVSDTDDDGVKYMVGKLMESPQVWEVVRLMPGDIDEDRILNYITHLHQTSITRPHWPHCPNACIKNICGCWCHANTPQQESEKP